MLGQSCRRWANIEPTLGKCIVFAGMHTEYDAWFFNYHARCDAFSTGYDRTVPFIICNQRIPLIIALSSYIIALIHGIILVSTCIMA